MKKYIGFFAALLAVTMASCTNDDITFQEETVIEVNPSTVLKNFTFQYSAGALDGVESYQELRVRLYVYNEEGALVSSETKALRNYLTTTKFDVNLNADESYTAIAITDVVTDDPKYIPEYWGVTGENNLSTLRVTYLTSEDIVYGSQEILGIKSAKVIGGQNTTINVEAAGAMIVSFVANIHAYSNIRKIQMFTNRSNDYYDFMTDGSLKSNPNIEAYNVFLDFDPKENPNLEGIYSYKFIMPINNSKTVVGFRDAAGEILGTYTHEIGFDQGKEYLFYVELDPEDSTDDYFTTIIDVTGKTARSASLAPKAARANNINCCIKRNETVAETPSWMVKDLIK